MFHIIVTGYNCAPFVKKCYDSLKAQTCDRWVATFIDDGSTDDTRDEIAKLSHVFMESYLDNMGAAYRRHKVLHSYSSPDDIVVLLGMDDELMPNALERIKQEYDNGKLMTYGNWVDQGGTGLPDWFELEFPDEVHRDRSYRKVKYRSTAPNTFKRFLYNVIKPSDLQYDGEWYKATTESEVMFSCLEQCGKDRIGVIKDHIYLYNRTIGGTARTRFGVEYQNKIYNHVIKKPIRELWLDSK